MTIYASVSVLDQSSCIEKVSQFLGYRKYISDLRRRNSVSEKLAEELRQFGIFL